MPEVPPPPPRRPEGQPTIDSAIFDQDTPVRQQAALSPEAYGSNPFMADLPEASQEAEPSNPFLSGPMAPAPAAQVPRVAQANPSVDSPRGMPASSGQPRVIPPAMGAPLQSQPGAVSPEVRDAHAEFRRGGWKRPLVLVLVAGAVVGGMTLLPSAEKPAPTPVELSKAPPPAVIGRSLPPGRTTDEDVREAEIKQMKGRPNSDSEPSERPGDIPQEGEFANAFKAAAQ